mmetsp:Transcript_29041/g.72907  ORF Transcript_29041/g.72907 Transcript_29041/m.72907 type:complete len:253 (-) Transcript_29041:263-1021(-)
MSCCLWPVRETCDMHGRLADRLVGGHRGTPAPHHSNPSVALRRAATSASAAVALLPGDGLRQRVGVLQLILQQRLGLLDLLLQVEQLRGAVELARVLADLEEQVLLLHLAHLGRLLHRLVHKLRDVIHQHVLHRVHRLLQRLLHVAKAKHHHAQVLGEDATFFELRLSLLLRRFPLAGAGQEPGLAARHGSHSQSQSPGAALCASCRPAHQLRPVVRPPARQKGAGGAVCMRSLRVPGWKRVRSGGAGVGRA